jgi:hypothetical protein
MNAWVQPVSFHFQGDASLGAVVAALRPHGSRGLVFRRQGHALQPGYHVTEVKAGDFVTLDCGGNPDAWQETILQLEDLPATPEAPGPMAVGKFLAILDKVGGRVALQPESRLTFEVGPPGAAMQVFDVEALSVGAAEVVIELGPRPAICKPRHRAAQAAATACCSPQGKCC